MGRWQSCIETGRNLADRHQTKVRFLFAGVLNTIFGLGTYYVIYSFLSPLKFHYMTILVISHAVCTTFAFITNKFLVFKTSGNYLAEYGKFIGFQLPYFLINLMVLPILVEFVGINPVWAQMEFAVLANLASYFWHSRITFSTTKVAP